MDSLLEEDWQYEYLRDHNYIHLEQQAALDAAWQEEEYYRTTKFVVKYETKHKSKSFRRTCKKITLNRSRLFTQAPRAAVRCFVFNERQHENRSLV